MISEEPLVSIITPSLDQAEFVAEALASVDRQDYPRVEHVIVDGGSTDGTLELLRERTGPDRRVIELPGSSQSEALNAAFEDTRGELIGWLNTDDVFFTIDAVSSVVRRFAEEPGAVAVYGDGVVVDGTGRVLQHVATTDRGMDRLQQCSPFCQPSVFFRRSAINGTFLRADLDMTMDYELWLRLREKGRFAKVDRILAGDRMQPRAKTIVRWGDMAGELARLGDEYGVRPSSRPLERLRRLGRRIRGVGPLLTLDHGYRYAYPARVDARWRRIVRQVVLPYRLLDRL